jgi:hypothetical protein
MSYTIDLNDYFMPNYPTDMVGEWRFGQAMLAGTRGYWGDMYGMRPVTLLLGPSEKGTQTWMSMTAVELESQIEGVAAASGAVVVLGMGMGWAVVNTALREQVTQVTVVDRNSDVLELIERSGVLDQLPAEAREKIRIVQGDALEWRPDHKVDTLLADIWLRLVEHGKYDQARRMQANIQADQVHIWGQDLEIWRHCCRRQGNETAPTRDLIEQVAAEDIKLPLVLADRADLGQRVADVAREWAPREPEWWLED